MPVETRERLTKQVVQEARRLWKANPTVDAVGIRDMLRAATGAEVTDLKKLERLKENGKQHIKKPAKEVSKNPVKNCNESLLLFAKAVNFIEAAGGKNKAISIIHSVSAAIKNGNG